VNVDAQDDNLDTALIYASSRGHNNIVKHLIKTGANTDIQNNHGCTAIILAAHKGYPETLKYLLEANANTDLTSNNNNSVFTTDHKQNAQQIKHILKQHILFKQPYTLK